MSKLCVISFIAISQCYLMHTAYAEFFKDSELNLQLRHFYLDRDYNGSTPTDQDSWSQSLSLIFKSGYMDSGWVQIGLDASIRYALRLNEDNHVANNVMPFDALHNRQDSDQLKLGATLKLKVSQTELKIGELVIRNPLISTDPSRQLPTIFLGGLIESQDIANSKITLGRITKVNARYDDHYKDIALTFNDLTARSDGLDMLGIEYQFKQNYQFSYFFGRLQDIYDQHFLGVDYSKKFSDKVSLTSNLYYFNTREQGDALTDEIDSDSISSMNILKYGNHSFGLGYRQHFGETGYPALDGLIPQPYLANWMVLPYNRKHQRSFQLRYDYDLSGLGLKGLNIMNRYYTSDKAESGSIRDAKESEYNFIILYNIPDKYIKGLSFQWLHAVIKTDFGSDFDENRVALTYNYKFW